MRVPPVPSAHSIELVTRSMEPCTTRREISGGSDLDAPAIIALLAQSAMCLECLVKKTGVPAPEAQSVLQQSSYFVVMTVSAASCGACLQMRVVYRLAEQIVPPQTRRRAVTNASAVWRFLDEHRDKLFCSHCLAVAVGAPKRLDRALAEAEGRGALRRHGRCSTCSKERLLCGLAA